METTHSPPRFTNTTSGSISRVCSRLYCRPGRGSSVRMNSSAACASSEVTWAAFDRSFRSRFCSRCRWLSTISAATSIARRRSSSRASASAAETPVRIPIRLTSVLARINLGKFLLLRGDLDHQAFAQIARPHPGRIQMLHQVDAPPDQFNGFGDQRVCTVPVDVPVCICGFVLVRNLAEARAPALPRWRPGTRPRPDCRPRTPRRQAAPAPGSELPVATPGDRTESSAGRGKFSNEGFSLSSYSG